MARLLLRLTGCRGLLIGGLLLIASSAFAEAVRYVAPAAKGEGTGQDAQNAAAYLNEAFWQEVQGLLAQGPVTVRFLDGVYSGPELNLNGVGHDQHRLTLRGDTSDGAVFSGDTNWYIRLRGSHHITFTDLHFRGPVRSFPIHMQELGSRDRPSHHIRIEDCTFTDMHTVVYGALGVVNGSHHITVRGCTFRGVGLDGRAHMAYNTHGAHHLYYYDNIFEDCTGEYVRFRNGCEHVEVARNIFRSTEPKYNSPFVSMPLFNDVDPGDEIFSNDILIHGNHFQFHPDHPGQPENDFHHGQDWYQYAIIFANYGYSHPDYNYLPTPEQMQELMTGPVEHRRGLLQQYTGIRLNNVHVYDNTYINARKEVAFGAIAQYGATPNGWEGYIDIKPLINHQPPAGDWVRPSYLKEEKPWEQW